MDNICKELHEWVNDLPRSNIDDDGIILTNGIYFFFQKSEKAHNLDRIVRIGTHKGQRRLKSRLFEHIKPNKDRSIFRKHIGRCLLKGDIFLNYWNIDFTTKKSKKCFISANSPKQASVEAEVTNYILNNFTFSAIELKDVGTRCFFEKKLLATCSRCSFCKPSSNWLGLKHSNPVIHKGLWNIKDLDGEILSRDEFFRLRNIA